MRACKRDANHRDIVDALRAIGCSVADTGGAGDGFPDIVVGIPGNVILMEIKDGDKPPSAQKLTPEQQIFHTEWRGPIHIVNSVARAISVVNEYRRGK